MGPGRRRHRRLRRAPALPRGCGLRRLPLVRDALPARRQWRARDTRLRRGAALDRRAGGRGAHGMRLRYGVIGAGVVAPQHLEAIAALDDAELIGISDHESAVARAQEAGCPAFGDHRELLALEPDVVVICTPHPSHPALTIEALEAGAHVLVEKPLAPQDRKSTRL